MNKASKALVYAENAYQWPEKLGVGKPYSVDETVEDFVKAMILDKMGRKKEAEVLYHKLTDNADITRGATSVNYLTVLAMSRLGLKAEAEKYFNSWIEQSRNKTMTEWAKLMNTNQKDKAAALIRPDAPRTGENVPDYAVVQTAPSASQVTRGSAGRGDADFELVNEIAQKYTGR